MTFCSGDSWEEQLCSSRPAPGWGSGQAKCNGTCSGDCTCTCTCSGDCTCTYCSGASTLTSSDACTFTCSDDYTWSGACTCTFSDPFTWSVAYLFILVCTCNCSGAYKCTLKVLVLVLFKVFVHVFVPGCCTCSISFTCSFTSTLHFIRIGIYTYCLLGLALRIVFVHALVLSQGQVLVPGCFTSSDPFFAFLGLFTLIYS